MIGLARRLGIASAAFVVTWAAAVLMGQWLFGSANVLAYYIAAVVAVLVYLVMLRCDARFASRCRPLVPGG